MTSPLGVQIQPTDELSEKNNDELNNIIITNEDQNLVIIKDWLKKQPHLPDEWEDSCLRAFLRGCSYSLEKTKRKLDMYFTMRAACPEFFTDRDVNRPNIKDFLTRGQQFTMPGLTADGRRVSVLRAKEGLFKEIKPHNVIDCLKIIMMIADVRMCEETDGVTGDIYIFDAEVILPIHLKVLMSLLIQFKQFLICIQAAFPLKLKEVHVVNISPVIEIVYNLLLKPLLKEKIKKRIFFHKDCTGLQEFISKDMLPLEFGGTGLTHAEANALWFKKLKEYTPWFKEQESVKANEALRPGKPTNYDELFGIDGSFKQLTID